MINNDPPILKADHADKQSDTGAHCNAEIPRDAHQHPFSESGDSEYHEQNTCDKHSPQCGLPGISQLSHNGVGEEGVQTHPGREADGPVGVQAHHETRECGSKAGGDEARTLLHPRGGHHLRVHKDDVGHRHKGSQARTQLYADGGI